MAKRNTKPAATAARLTKQSQALQLRSFGYTIRGIATALGCGKSTAERYLSEAFAAERATISRAKADLVETELARFDTYLQVIAPKVQKGDVRAIDTALRIGERRARLLGLDAPMKVAPTDPDGNPLQPRHDLTQLSDEDLKALAELVAKMGGLAVPHP